MKNLTVVLRVIYIIVGVIFFHIPFGIMTWDRGVERGAVFLQRWCVRLSRVALGHRSGSPEALWLICSPLTPLFWDVDVRVENIAFWRSSSVVVAANKWQL